MTNDERNVTGQSLRVGRVCPQRAGLRSGAYGGALRTDAPYPPTDHYRVLFNDEQASITTAGASAQKRTLPSARGTGFRPPSDPAGAFDGDSAGLRRSHRRPD